MQQTSEQNPIFLEVIRTGAFNSKLKTSSGRQMRYAAWCERCRAKVNLIQKNEMSFKNVETGVLHVQLVFTGNLLVCQNSLNQKLESKQ